MYFCEIKDVMILTAFSISSVPNKTDAVIRFRASSMFFTVIPVAYTCGTLFPRSR